MLNLIISRTGYGKTTYIKEKIKELVENDNEIILIIPEQISFESEREVLRAVGAKKLKNASVMSFTRLCSKFFAKYGGREKPYIDNVGKTAVMEQVLKKLSSSLELFKKSAATPQFCEIMIDLAASAKKNAVTPSLLLSCAHKDNGILKRKLEETALILSEYDELLNKDYFDPLDDISVVAERIGKTDFFENKTVFIDAFTGFTAQQMIIIEQIIKSAENTYISLGFDGVYSKKALSTFSNMAKSALDLKRIATDNGIGVADDVVLTDNHRFKNEELDFLEKNIYSEDKNIYDSECNNIFITEVKNIYEEAEYVAKTIIKLTKDNDFRYRDIAVISRDANEYNGIIDETFEKYNIPVFVDNREGVENFNIFKLVSFALSAVCKNYDNESVISLLKTGITDVSMKEASLFELYVNVWRINKKEFLNEFNLPVDSFLSGDEKYLEASLKSIENARKTIIEPLVKFNKSKGKTAASYVKALYQLIKDYNCDKNLKKVANNLLDKGYNRLLESTVRSYDVLIHIFDQLYLSLGESELELKRFYEIFTSAVALLDIGSLPQGLDAVAVGSAERMRPKSPKVTFIIGANEGVFPSAKSGNGLFSDDELSRLKQNGVILPFYDVDTAVDEQYLAYCAVCSPSEKLYVSYPISSLSGDIKEPSDIVENLTSIFPNLKIEKYDNLSICCENDALKAFAVSKGNDNEIEEYFNKHFDERFQRIECAGEDKLSLINSKTARELYGKNIYTSASKIETFNKCRFYYFCKYGLHANPIKQAKVDNLSRGSLVHFVLEKMINEYTPEQFFELSKEEVLKEVRKLGEEFYKSAISLKQQTAVENYRFLKLCDMICDLVERVFDELRQSEFSIVKTEFSVGGKEPDIPAYEVEFDDGKIILTGYIDRLDMANKNEKKIIRIIDYKTGLKKLNLSDVCFGQNMQMPLYMKTVVENGKEKLGQVLPGGMFYYVAKDSVINATRETDDESVKKGRLKELKMDGMFLGDEDAYTAIEPECKGIYSPVLLKKDGSFASSVHYYTIEQYNILSDFIDLKLKQTAKGIVDGEITPKPLDGTGYSACDYCDYSNVCQFKGEHDKVPKLKDTEAFRFMLDEINKEKGEQN
ncbi:MAG: PD-(D/E)XK nuclease family protein [Acutalibacteraceae bacterium]